MTNQVDKAKIKESVARLREYGYPKVEPEMQMGFVHNNVDCIGCRACEIACKDKNGLDAGPRFRRVQYVEGGIYPDVFAFKINMSCNHCAEPACLPACPTGAIFKREKDGVVDIDSTLCIGCRKCEAACPYGAPQFDPVENVVKKCNMCVDQLDAGRKPYCVEACMMRVLDVLPIDELRDGSADTKAIGPNDEVVSQVKGMADPNLTHPSIVFVPHSKGKMDG